MHKPLGVILLALLNIFGGALFAISGAATVLIGEPMYIGVMGNAQKMTYISSFVGVATLIFGLLGMAIGYGLWRLREWARLVYLIILAIGILFSFMMLIYGNKGYGGYIVIYSIIAWYLTRPHVKESFS